MIDTSAPSSVREFLTTMPDSYAQAFGAQQVAEHLRIVRARGSRLVHAEVCAESDSRSVCVVADDRPGLLAIVTDALLIHGLSVKSAQVYCRQRADGGTEAVDFFQLQAAPASSDARPIEAGEIANFTQTLSELVAENMHRSSPGRASAPPSAPWRVYFELEAMQRGKFVLLIEAPDFDGLLNAVTTTLHEHGIRIVASEIRTEGGVARDRFELASGDDQVLDAARLSDVQQAVQQAVRAGVQ